MTKVNKKLQKVFDKIESLNWIVTHENDNIYYLSRFSPYGQDFGFSVDTENDVSLFVENIYAYYSDYDPSEEAYFWLDSSGHGKYGAPYSMIDVYKDMEACQEMVLQLYNDLREFL